jgi:predicted Ser/Thr protein kinase
MRSPPTSPRKNSWSSWAGILAPARPTRRSRSAFGASSGRSSDADTGSRSTKRRSEPPIHPLARGFTGPSEPAPSGAVTSPPRKQPALPSREELTALPARSLSIGGPGNPDVVQVEYRGRTLVVKDFAPRSRWVRATVGRWITRREARAWEVLDGHPDVPQFYGRIDSEAFAVEYRPGRHLSRSMKVSDDFLPRLENAVRGMHARGVVHLDLKHRDNVLAGPDGQPILIDFGSALVFRPGSLWARILLPVLAWVDQGAVRKWREKLTGPDRPSSHPG